MSLRKVGNVKEFLLRFAKGFNNQELTGNEKDETRESIFYRVKKMSNVLQGNY